MKSPKLEQLIRHCVQAQYRIRPVPSTLTESLPIYTHFASLGNIVQYRQDQCPVTKNRLETIKMIYHDPNIEPDSIKDGHIVRYGDLVFDDSQRNKLTELENTLMNQHTLEIPDSDKKYSLVLDFLTRNEESLTRARDTAFADQFNIPKQGSVKDRVTQANEKRDQKLKGFKGLFGLS
jgi:hypothetical protein